MKYSNVASRIFASLIAATLLALILAGCGGGSRPVPPVIAQQPASQTVLSGQTATFSVTLVDAAGASYQWLRDGAPIAGATQPSVALAPAKLADSGSLWSVQVSNSAGLVTSAQATLTVAPAPAPLGISLIAAGVGDVTRIVADGGGNTIIARAESSSQGRSVVARKFAPDGSVLPLGPNGDGIVLPGFYSASGYPRTFTGLALEAAGVMYVSTVIAGSAGINAFPAVGGALWRVTAGGETTRIADWPADSAGAMAPAAIAVAPDGALYFVDLISGYLAKWTPAGTVLIGSRLRFPGANLFSLPQDTFITIDRNNTVYVISGFVLRKVVDGALVLVAGNPDFPFAGMVPPAGHPGTPGTSDGQGRDAGFTGPAGLVSDTAGNLYVADLEVLRKVTPDGTVTTVAGQRGVTTLITGPLPGGLGRVVSLAMGPDGVLQAAVLPGGAFVPDMSLVMIKLP